MRDTEAHWLLRLPHVKINICFFFLKRLFPLRGRARDGTFPTLTMTHEFVIVVLSFFIYV